MQVAMSEDMKQLHLLSQLCPDFRVHHIDAFVKQFGETDVSFENLNAMELPRVSRWFYNHEERFRDYVKQFRLHEHQRLFWGDAQFPSRLLSQSHPPAILSYQGDVSVLENPCVAVVGSRQPSNLGIQWVRRNIPYLCESGITIVSGGARGIDIEAHTSSVQAGGKTAVVLPSGINHPYPPAHRDIFDHIICENGVLLSELPDDERVTKLSFLRRNRLIAGASDLVIIVEAKQKSGTMMTARWALAENIELGVVPGSPLLENYEGSLNLIRDGATPLMGFQDIVNLLNEKKILKK